jgi:hypothetical protein
MTWCLFSFPSPRGPHRAVAFWKRQNGDRVFLCRACLDHGFDKADSNPSLEPVDWGWL